MMGRWSEVVNGKRSKWDGMSEVSGASQLASRAAGQDPWEVLTTLGPTAYPQLTSRRVSRTVLSPRPLLSRRCHLIKRPPVAVVNELVQLNLPVNNLSDIRHKHCQ